MLSTTTWNRIKRLAPLLGLLLFGCALWILYRELRGHHVQDIVQSFQAISRDRLGLAFALTILSYLVLTGYDRLAFVYIQVPLRYSRIALTSFISYAFSNTMGYSWLTGGSIRFRLYSSWGLSTIEITQVVAFCLTTFWLGFLLLSGDILIFYPELAFPFVHLPLATAPLIGAVFLSLPTGYLLWGALKKKPFRIRKWEFRLPSLRVSLGQMTLSVVDWMVAASVFYFLLPTAEGLSFLDVLCIFLFAQIAGTISQIPGGIGVFESIVLLSLQPVLPATSIVGSLLLFRAIYYIFPLGTAVILLGFYELLEHQKQRPPIRWLRSGFGQWVPEVAPHVLAFSTFIGGSLLLFSGATPVIGSRLSTLNAWVPLPCIELSHFLASTAGAGLLLLSRGIQRRLASSFRLAIPLILMGAVFSLTKGSGYEEPLILLVLLTVLLPAREHFHRQDRLIAESFTPGWITGILFILSGSIWLGVFSYQHQAYSDALWWQFSLTGDLSRFLRGSLGAIGMILLFVVARLLRPVPPEPTLPTPTELEKAWAIIKTHGRAASSLVLLGDKELLFHERGSAFLMYGIQRRSWISMGDPVGPEEDASDLVWRFHELADRHGGWTVFYDVAQCHLPLYVDLGLTLLKLGDEARIALPSFKIRDAAHGGSLQMMHRKERAGYSFQVIPMGRGASVWPECRVVSETWMAGKGKTEGGFSLGSFHEDYLQRFPIAVVRKEGRVVAFANLWSGTRKEELSIDLLRYLPEAPEDILHYLLTRLLIWGKENGYAWFQMGRTPLSDHEEPMLAPLWKRTADVNLHRWQLAGPEQDLRPYIQRFHLHWEPRYLASPGGLALPHVLTDLVTLISASPLDTRPS